ncbi:hypothetical protein [Sulfitobacter guttiformis]|nr:hypothetical protein [Sulfitobacter guttiformis]KIN73720.1 hypothetical protein Z949_2912 [Sulfitobacter guttiformis KCTC 32187]
MRCTDIADLGQQDIDMVVLAPQKLREHDDFVLVARVTDFTPVRG